MLHTKNSAGYSQWKEALNKKESLESVGVFLIFTPFSSRIVSIANFQVKFKDFLGKNKSLNLSY